MTDVRHCSRVLRGMDSVVRTNVAILGNREPHVHAHVIPRYEGEINHDRAPWDGAPEKTEYTSETCDKMMAMLRTRFWINR